LIVRRNQNTFELYIGSEKVGLLSKGFVAHLSYLVEKDKLQDLPSEIQGLMIRKRGSVKEYFGMGRIVVNSDV